MSNAKQAVDSAKAVVGFDEAVNPNILKLATKEMLDELKSGNSIIIRRSASGNRKVFKLSKGFDNQLSLKDTTAKLDYGKTPATLAGLTELITTLAARGGTKSVGGQLVNKAEETIRQLLPSST